MFRRGRDRLVNDTTPESHSAHHRGDGNDTQEGREQRFVPKGVDITRPSIARIYDYYLGGKTNWMADEIFAEKVIKQLPIVQDMALANRQFLNRAVAYLCDSGVRQFLDIGAGVPSVGNTHQVADSVAQGCRVVYVDNEPIAVAHARDLLDRGGDPDRQTMIEADLRDPDDLWSKALDSGLLDPDEPVGLLMIAVLHIAQPHQVDGTELGPTAVARYRELVPPGSYLAISHATDDGIPPQQAEQLNKVIEMYEKSSGSAILRTRDQIAEFMGDFEVVDPGMAWTPEWHPEYQRFALSADVHFAQASEAAVWAGVAQKS
jgi:hypothetical protein